MEEIYILTEKISSYLDNTVKPVLKWPLKNRQIKVLKTDGSLVQVESIAECSRAVCNSFDLH